MRKLHIDLLGYINDMADKAYEDIDAVPREILLALMGAAALTAVSMTYGSEALLEEMVGEVDWLSLVGEG